MATGHTHRVLDGEITTLNEFALECSKSFVLSWRDGDRLAYPRLDYTYHTERLAEASKRLAYWEAADEATKYAMWSEYVYKLERAAMDAKNKAEKNRVILESLIVEAKRKVVPETHARFKEFMINQLQETLEHDGTFKPHWYAALNYPEWCEAQMPDILRDFEYHAGEIRKSIENYEKSVAWISTLAGLFGLEVK